MKSRPRFFYILVYWQIRTNAKTFMDKFLLFEIIRGSRGNFTTMSYSNGGHTTRGCSRRLGLPGRQPIWATPFRLCMPHCFGDLVAKLFGLLSSDHGVVARAAVQPVWTTSPSRPPFSMLRISQPQREQFSHWLRSICFS